MAIPPFREDGWLPTGHDVAEWGEIEARFGGVDNSRRRILTERLIRLQQGLVQFGVRGLLVIDGSYISAKSEPGDFDVLLVAEPGIDALKQGNPSLKNLLDPQVAEANDYSILYTQTNTPNLDLLKTMWDYAKDGRTEKGVIEVTL